MSQSELPTWRYSLLNKVPQPKMGENFTYTVGAHLFERVYLHTGNSDWLTFCSPFKKRVWRTNESIGLCLYLPHSRSYTRMKAAGPNIDVGDVSLFHTAVGQSLRWGLFRKWVFLAPYMEWYGRYWVGRHARSCVGLHWCCTVFMTGNVCKWATEFVINLSRGIFFYCVTLFTWCRILLRNYPA